MFSKNEIKLKQENCFFMVKNVNHSYFHTTITADQAAGANEILKNFILNIIIIILS